MNLRLVIALVSLMVNMEAMAETFGIYPGDANPPYELICDDSAGQRYVVKLESTTLAQKTMKVIFEGKTIEFLVSGYDECIENGCSNPYDHSRYYTDDKSTDLLIDHDRDGGAATGVLFGSKVKCRRVD
jgi:hypothetical protein